MPYLLERGYAVIEKLLAAFAEDRTDVGAEEVADILWLAARVDAAGRPGQTDGPSGVGPADGTATQRHDTDQRPAGADREPDTQLFPSGRTATRDTGESDGDGRWGVPLRVPRADTLPDPLALMRALRPMGRRAIGGTGDQLDEQATVERSVERLLPSPVLLPAQRSWLELALVVDTHHSMLLWSDLVEELRRTLTRSGIFRDVRTWHLSGTEHGVVPAVAHHRDAPPRNPAELADPSGHRLILVLTDAVADGWRGGALHEVLVHWSGHNAVAVLNVLPERLWTRGSVRPVPLWLGADHPASATRSWHRTPATPRTRLRRRRVNPPTAPGAAAVPMVSTAPRSLTRLARITAGDSSRQLLPCLHLDSRPVDPLTRPAVTDTAPTGLAAVERFRASASPTAQQLAAYLAAVPLTLPVMTLVRRSLLPFSEHGHLAEVALGGLFESWGTSASAAPATDLTFDFLPGVRDVLLGSQRRSDVAAVQELVRQRVWDFLHRHRGATREFSATRVTRGAGGRRRVAEEAEAFAEQWRGEGDTAAQSLAGPRLQHSGLDGRLVTVWSKDTPPAPASLGLLLTPRVVLTVRTPFTDRNQRAVGIDGREVACWRIWSEDSVSGVTLLLAQEDLTDARTWEARGLRRLLWGTPGPGTSLSVDIDAFSEVGDPVTLGGRTHRGPDSLRVEITRPHPTTGWPQLLGAPLSRAGVFTGLIVGREPGGDRLLARPARALLEDEGFRAMLGRYMEVPYRVQELAETEEMVLAALPHRHVPLRAALEFKVYSPGRSAPTVDAKASERAAEAVRAIMREAEIQGRFLKQRGPVRADWLIQFDTPFALWNLGRLLVDLPDRLVDAGVRSDARVVVGVVVATLSDYPGDAWPDAATRTVMAPEFRRRLGEMAAAGERTLALAVSRRALLQITESLGRSVEREFRPFGAADSGAGEGWFWSTYPELLGRDLVVSESRGQEDPARPLPRCTAEASGENTEGCGGKVPPGYPGCLEHLSAADRSAYLSTLAPGASVDFSGTRFSEALLTELLDSVRDSEGRVRLGRAVFDGAVFSEDCDVRDAVFAGDAVFRSAVFHGAARFSRVFFTHDCEFDQATFNGWAHFPEVTVLGRASLHAVTCNAAADFALSRFEGTTLVMRTTFNAAASFKGCRFHEDVSFADTTFEESSWQDVRFSGPVSYVAATFHRPAQFGGTAFAADVFFDRATFAEGVDFEHVSFRGTASLQDVTLTGRANFNGAHFQGRADFTGFVPPIAVPQPWLDPFIELVTRPRAVLIDFATICRLFASRPRTAVADRLLREASELGWLAPQPEVDSGDPYAVLQGIALSHPDSAAVGHLERLLTREELTAVNSSMPTPYADPLVRSWHALGTQLAFVTECSQEAALRYLDLRSLADVFGPHIYGRGASGRPDTYRGALDRALEALDVPPANALLLSSNPDALQVAQAVGVPFLGCVRDDEQADLLSRSGANAVVFSLQTVLDTVRTVHQERD